VKSSKRQLQGPGLRRADRRESAGDTPEFSRKARKHGFQNLTLDKLMALKNADIL